MKSLSLVIAIILLFQTTCLAEHWKVKDLYHKFDFTNSKYPEYKEILGEWEIKHEEIKKSFSEDFEKEENIFSFLSGEWGIENGVCYQMEEGFSSTTKAIIKESFEDFYLSMNVYPKSNENTLMIYFGCENEQSVNSIEINSYQSKLILNGEETVGKGSIVKDGEYNIALQIYNGELKLFCDEKEIFSKKGIGKISGKAGIGTWNSKIAFDNFKIEQIPEMGRDNKLISAEKGKSLLYFPTLSAQNFIITADIAAGKIYDGEIGIFVRGEENADGYYVGMDKKSIYIQKKYNGKSTTLKRENLKPQSEKFYTLSVVCDNEKISAILDGEEIIFAKDSDIKGGACGLFSNNCRIYCTDISMSLLEEQLPPIFSSGDTTYYVDYENGNDFNDGRKESLAWKSIDRINQMNFKSGDKILLKCGGEYEGTLVLKNTDANLGEGVLISSYGEGEKPVITACTTGIEIENCKNIKISDIAINLRHYGKKGNIKIGTGNAIRIENSKTLSFSDISLKAMNDGTDTLPINANTSECYEELVLENITYSGFLGEGIFLNNEPYQIKNDDGEIKNHWSYKYMKNLKNRNIITEYRPDDVVLRAEFASMILAALGLEESAYRGIFKDIREDDWYASKMQTLSDWRILPTEMTAEKKALPKSPLLREEAAAIAALVFGIESEEKAEYADIEDASFWTIKYINAVTKEEIMTGDNNSFCPKNTLTRAEAAVILSALLEKQGGEV